MMNVPQTVGVIGFGVMGASMARNIAAKGYRVLGHSRTRSKVIASEPDGITPSSLEDLGRACSVALLSVTDGRAVESIIFGSAGSGTRGLASLLPPDSLIIDTSTIAPSEAAEYQRRLQQHGIRFVDAPVTGGDVGARNGTLTVMCGGDDESVKRALPFLQCIGSKIFHIGLPGSTSV